MVFKLDDTGGKSSSDAGAAKHSDNKKIDDKPDDNKKNDQHQANDGTDHKDASGESKGFSFSDAVTGVEHYFGGLFQKSKSDTATLAGGGDLPKVQLTDNSNNKSTPAASDGSALTKTWDWLSENSQWSKWFSDNPTDPATTKTFDNSDGSKSTVAIGDKGVNVDIKNKDGSDSKAHVDGHAIAVENSNGEKAVKNKQTGSFDESGPHGEKFHRDANGNLSVDDGEGHSLTRQGRGPDSKWFITDDDGTKREVSRDEVRTFFKDARYQFRQHMGRPPADETPEQKAQRHAELDQAGTVQSATDSQGVAKTHLNSTDGQTHVVTDEHGNKKIVLGSGSDQTAIQLQANSRDFTVTANGGADQYRMHWVAEGGDGHHGRWEAQDKDGHPTDAVSMEGGKLHVGNETISVGSDGTLQVTRDATTTHVNADGSVRVTDNAAGTTADVAAHSNTVSVPTTDGHGSAQMTATGETSSLTAPNGLKTNTNGETHEVQQEKILDGHKVIDTINTQKGTADFQTPDGATHIGTDSQGRSTIQLWSGTKIDGDGNIELFDGTHISSDNCVSFNDGTYVDAKGNVSKDGDYLGTAGGGGWSSDASSDDSGVQSQVTSIQGQAAALAAAIGAKPGSASESDVGQLRALLDQLGMFQGLAMQAGDGNTLASINSAVGIVNQGIAQGELQIAQQAALTAKFGDANPDLLHAVHDSTPNTVSPEDINRIALAMGRAIPGQEKAEEKQSPSSSSSGSNLT